MLNMRFENVVIEASGYALPEEVVTSLDIERRLAPVYDRLGLHEGRLELMSGVRERRFWPPGMLPSQAAVLAAKDALQRSAVPRSHIGCLLHTAVSRDCLEPATASFVHEALELSAGVLMFDISNACLGFADGMLVTANMIELGQIRAGIVVAGESSRQLVESTIQHLLSRPDLSRRQFKQAFASLTIGSGAAATILCHRSLVSSRSAAAGPIGRPRLLGAVALSATQHCRLCHGSGDTGFTADATMTMDTDSETLLIHGCDLAARTWEIFLAHMGWEKESVDRCFTHQVGVAHRERLYEAIGLDIGKDFSTVETLGNIGSVSLPLTYAMGTRLRPPARGERIALLGIGSGLHCLMMGLEV